MTVGSLFSGIGGLDLGLERAGMEVRWQVENNTFCQRVLAKHWPNIRRYGDITSLTGAELESVDMICGGFPCQPVSQAGKQIGNTRSQEGQPDDKRWLWPDFARLLGVLRPRYALVENVPGLFTANGGHAFAEILTDLADLGYDCEWSVLSAADVGAPHLRKRVWIVAHADRSGNRLQSRHTEAGGQRRQHTNASEPAVVSPDDGETRPEGSDTGCEDVAHADRERTWNVGENVRKGYFQVNTFDDASGSGGGFDQSRNRETVAHANGEGLEGRELLSERASERTVGTSGMADADSGGCVGIGESQQPPLEGARWRQLNGCSPDGRFFDAEIGGQWEPEPSVGRVAHGIPKRVDRLRGLGNAVVPQVAEWIGKRILLSFDDTRVLKF